MVIKEENEYKRVSILESSFNKARLDLATYPCCFITAFKTNDENNKEISHNENQKKNKELERDIKESGLSYIKVEGKYDNIKEESYCVIDTGIYSPKDFIKLAVSWCGKYDQESVLVTEPDVANTEPNKLIKAIGRLYDKNGTVLDEFNNATMDDAEEYFTNIFGKTFAFTEALDMDIKEKKYDIYNWISGMGAKSEFKKKYPNL